MADLLSTGISGVRSYQRALATVGNNIANVDTDGYSRQRLEIQQNTSDLGGTISIGNGARAVQVQRIYDSFATASLRSNTSQLAQHEAVLKYAQQLENTLADKQLSLSTVIDSFYAAVQEVTISPASSTARQSMLNTGHSVVSQFQAIGAQISRVDADSLADVESKTDALNRMADQLASVNSSLSRTIDKAKQPSELLDMRDKLLQDMSKLLRIHAVESDNGMVDVHIGEVASGQLLVDGKSTNVIGVQANPDNPEQAMLVLDPALNREHVKSVAGGEIGGIMSFRRETLQNLRDDLDGIATAFVNKNNEVHKLGINAHGEFGGELFSVANVFTLNAGLNQGNALVHISTESNVSVARTPMQLSYNGGDQTWTLSNQASKQSTTGRGELTLNGVTVSITGKPVDGDVFTLEPSKRAIDAIEVAIADQAGIAAGGALSVGRNSANDTETRILLDHQQVPSLPAMDTSMDDLLRNNIAEVAGTSVMASSRPAFVIPAYTNNARFYLDNESLGADVKLQVFTREGRQLFGEPLPEADQSQMLSTTNGFSITAQYNTDYLNKSGADGYMDGNFVVSNPSQGDSRQHFSLQGNLGEDLIVFVTGTGSGHMSAQWGEITPPDPREVLRQNIDIRMGANNSYQLLDADTGTSIANGTLLGNQIEHNGWRVSFEGPVNDGNVFHVRGNDYLSGDNRTMLAMAELQSDKAVFGGRGDFTEVYTDVIGGLGNQVVQASISVSAQQIMVDQAQEQRDQTSAVSLDEEAADLLRFQQAYQASAQVISTANKLFDTILNVG